MLPLTETLCSLLNVFLGGDIFVTVVRRLFLPALLSEFF